MKKSVFFWVYLFLLGFSLLNAHAVGTKGTAMEGDTYLNSPEAAQEAVNGGTNGPATLQVDANVKTNHGSDLGMKSGTTVTASPGTVTLTSKDTITEDSNSYTNVENLVLTENTVSVDTAESLESNNVKATGVVEFSQMKNTDAFDAKHLDAIEITTPSGTVTMTNVNDINYLNGNYNFEHADYIKTNNFEAVNINDFSSDAQKFTTTSADTLTSDCLEISKIENAEFIIDETKLFDKTKTIEMKDCLGNNINFQGNDDGSALIVSKDTPYSYSIAKGTLTISHDGYDEVLSTFSTAAGIMNNNGLTMIEMNPTTAYTQKNNDNYLDKGNTLKDFSIYIPKNAAKYLLFIRKAQEEAEPIIDYCLQCGYMDFITHKFVLKGIVNYLRPVFNDKFELITPKLSIVYNSTDKYNNVVFEMDENNVIANNLVISNDNINNINTDKIIAFVYNGEYHLYESVENGEVVGRIKVNYYFAPYTIKKISTDYGKEYHKPLIFENGALIMDKEGNTLTIRSQNQGNAINVLKEDIYNYDKKFEDCKLISESLFGSMNLFEWINE